MTKYELVARATKITETLQNHIKIRLYSINADLDQMETGKTVHPKYNADNLVHEFRMLEHHAELAHEDMETLIADFKKGPANDEYRLRF